MATLKEFQHGKTGVQVYIRVNHQDPQVKRRIVYGFMSGYESESNGKQMQVWVDIKPDVPVNIPCAGVTISAQFKDQEKTMILKRKQPDYQNHFTVVIKKGDNSESFDYHASINDANTELLTFRPMIKLVHSIASYRTRFPEQCRLQSLNPITDMMTAVKLIKYGRSAKNPRSRQHG